MRLQPSRQYLIRELLEKTIAVMRENTDIVSLNVVTKECVVVCKRNTSMYSLTRCYCQCSQLFLLPDLNSEKLLRFQGTKMSICICNFTILDELETLVTTFKLIGNNTFVHYTFSYFPILSPEPLSYNYFQRGSFVKYKTFAF